MSSPECWIAWTRLNTLEMLWMENGRRASPAWNSSPSRLHGDPQLVRLDAGERGDVVGDLAAPDQRADFIENLVQQLLHDDLRGDTGAPTRAHPGQRECAAS